MSLTYSFTGVTVSSTYGRLVQVVGGYFYDGLGNLLVRNGILNGVTSNGIFRTILVNYVTGNGVINTGDDTTVSFSRSGSQGVQGPPGTIQPPVLTTSQRNSIVSPSLGYTSFISDAIANDSSVGVLQTYNGSVWKSCW